MRKVFSVTATVLAGTLVLAGCAPQEPVALDSQSTTPAVEATIETESGVDDIVGEQELGSATQAETVLLLTYLIEEEKLAHDVYTVLYKSMDRRCLPTFLKVRPSTRIQF